ncbi:PBECR2 nuclease fold domain-containing protein, partial [Helicobacter ailurogastricus]|uniref:PBECR2 nuclease fold domain-containing protein n=1 Tax=Helicobacter ailurogastricus TaxID=1578720 RepID=UPI0032DBE729
NIQTPLNEDTTTPLQTDLSAQEAEQIGAKERPYEVITDKEAFIQDLDLSVNATPIPASLDVEGFLKSLEGVENKENFIKHLQDKGTQEQRLAYLNLVEPTLKTPDIELFFKDPEKKEYIKAFKKENGKDLTYLLVTADGDRLLLTGLPVRQKSYIERQIRDADIIHSFIQPGRLDTQGGLTPSGLPTKDSTTPPLQTDLSPQEITQEQALKI